MVFVDVPRCRRVVSGRQRPWNALASELVPVRGPQRFASPLHGPRFTVKSALDLTRLNRQKPPSIAAASFSRTVGSNEAEPALEGRAKPPPHRAPPRLAHGLVSLGAGTACGVGPTGRSTASAMAKPTGNPCINLGEKELYGGLVKTQRGIDNVARCPPVLAPLVGGGLALYLHHRRINSDEEGHWTDAIGVGGVRMALSFAVLIWLCQQVHCWRSLLLLMLSLLSPAGRQEWSVQRTPRLLALFVALLALEPPGFLPVPSPSPDDWGQPRYRKPACAGLSFRPAIHTDI